MKISGKISKLNSELGYGFVKCSSVGEVFFSTESELKGTSFDLLKINDSVSIIAIETDRGLFAQSLVLGSIVKKSSSAEVSL